MLSATSARRANDEDDALVRVNLPLVHHVVASVRSRLPRHVDAEDLVSVALTALLAAARSYDPSRGVPFEAYASMRMRGAITDELRRMDWAPRSVRAQGRRVEEAAERLAGRGGTASVADVAAAVGMSEDDVARLHADVHRATVLNYDAFISPDQGGNLPPCGGATPEELVLELERHGYLRDAIRLLPDRLRAVVVGYFLEQRPMQELAAELGVTESRVSHMRAQALSLLREALVAGLEAEAPPPAQGVAARRRAAYCHAVATASDHRTRLSRQPVAVAPSNVQGKR